MNQSTTKRGHLVTDSLNNARDPALVLSFNKRIQEANMHTKTPWAFKPSQKSGRMSVRSFIQAQREGDMPYGLEVAGDDYTGYGDDARRDADLKRIVQCVNSHDELVAALKYVKQWFSDWGLAIGPAEENLFDVVDKAIDAGESS